MSNKSLFCKYNSTVNKKAEIEPSHKVINTYLKENGTDYRFMVGDHPIKELNDRESDNITVGRC